MAGRGGSSTEFGRRVLALVGRVPAGRVVTYGDLARLAGRPGAARAVGNLMRRAVVPGLPYHRVIAAGGRLGGYGGHEGVKQALLRQEGVPVSGGRVRRFAEYRWSPRRTALNKSRATARNS
jgi:O-6-methylguanine DNA methyltransferase